MYQGMASSATTVTLRPVPTCMYGCLQASIPMSLPGHLVAALHCVQLITPCQCGKLLLGHFHWLVMTWSWTAILVQLSLSSNCQHKRQHKGRQVWDDKLVHYLNQYLQLSVQLCLREKHRCFWSSNLECVLMNCWQISCRPSSSELLGYPALHSRFSTSANKSATSR